MINRGVEQKSPAGTQRERFEEVLEFVDRHAVPLFDTKSGAHVFAVDKSGQRFLILAASGKSAPPMTVLLEWTARLSGK